MQVIGALDDFQHQLRLEPAAGPGDELADVAASRYQAFIPVPSHDLRHESMSGLLVAHVSALQVWLANLEICHYAKTVVCNQEGT